MRWNEAGEISLEGHVLIRAKLREACRSRRCMLFAGINSIYEQPCMA